MRLCHFLSATVTFVKGHGVSRQECLKKYAVLPCVVSTLRSKVQILVGPILFGGWMVPFSWPGTGTDLVLDTWSVSNKTVAWPQFDLNVSIKIKTIRSVLYSMLVYIFSSTSKRFFRVVCRAQTLTLGQVFEAVAHLRGPLLGVSGLHDRLRLGDHQLTHDDVWQRRDDGQGFSKVRLSLIKPNENL